MSASRCVAETSRKRRWLQFSLGSLLLVVVISGLLFGWILKLQIQKVFTERALDDKSEQLRRSEAVQRITNAASSFDTLETLPIQELLDEGPRTKTGPSEDELTQSFLLAEDKSDAERGWAAMIGRTFSPPLWSSQAYENAWKQWGLAEKPADYERAFMERYGLLAAPFDNRGLPMGMRETFGPLGKGITNDCLLCHAGSIAGQTYIGLGNAPLDIQSLYEDLFAANGLKLELPFTFSNVRGTFEAAAGLTYLMQFRDADLNVRSAVEMSSRSDTCASMPPWWNIKKKKTMYFTGGADARTIRSPMSFMLSPLNSGAYIKKQEPAFADIQAWLLTLQPPKYPFEMDDKLAAGGERLFAQNCARCHGTYGPDGEYPNKIVPLDVIGTDPNVAEALTPEAGEHYAKSWFGQETGPNGEPYLIQSDGYQAPPLDAIWATAPYLHNGSAPTVYHVLNSKARPKIYTRSYRTQREDYDPVKLGWKLAVLDAPPAPSLPAIERRKIYDTTQPGRSNSGHTFGDKLTEEERMAVIEYLKTL